MQRTRQMGVRFKVLHGRGEIGARSHEGMKREGMKHEGVKREGVKREGVKREEHEGVTRRIAS